MMLTTTATAGSQTLLPVPFACAVPNPSSTATADNEAGIVLFDSVTGKPTRTIPYSVAASIFADYEAGLNDGSSVAGGGGSNVTLAKAAVPLLFVGGVLLGVILALVVMGLWIRGRAGRLSRSRHASQSGSRMASKSGLESGSHCWVGHDEGTMEMETGTGRCQYQRQDSAAGQDELPTYDLAVENEGARREGSETSSRSSITVAERAAVDTTGTPTRDIGDCGRMAKTDVEEEMV